MYYWIGLRENGRWELFTSDTRKQGSVEESGYENVQGPYFTKAEAQEALDAANDV